MKLLGHLATNQTVILTEREEPWVIQLKALLHKEDRSTDKTRFAKKSLKLSELWLLRTAAQVVVCTTRTTCTHGDFESPTKYFTKFQADVVAMDEACRAVPSAMFVVLRSMKTVIVVGETHQLRAIVPSQRILMEGKSVDILAKHEMHPLQARLLDLGWPQILLANQYRMYPGAADLVKDIFYPGINMKDMHFHTSGRSSKYIARFERAFVAHGVRLSPQGRFPPAMLDIHGTLASGVGEGKSKQNTAMWKR